MEVDARFQSGARLKHRAEVLISRAGIGRRFEHDQFRRNWKVAGSRSKVAGRVFSSRSQWTFHVRPLAFDRAGCALRSAQIWRNRTPSLEHVGNVRFPVLVQRRRHADDDSINLANARKVRGGRKPFGG